MIIDTHSHLYYSEEKNTDLILQECKNEDIIVILNGTDKKSNLEVLELSKKYSNVYAAIGYEYSNAGKINEEDFILLENQIKNNRVVAIGEIGLDYYYTKDNKEAQKELFQKQLDIAEKYKLPVIVHSRDAVMDVYDLLSERDLKGSIHCYSGSIEIAKKFIQLGYYIGIDGPITFKNNKKQKELVKAICIDNILVETDSPYLTPEPNRGKRNSPLNLKYIIKQISIELGMSEEEISDKTARNAIRLFDLDV